MKHLKGIFTLLFNLYFLSVSLMSPYYCWRDAKHTDSYLRAIFVSPIVGIFKATHWPYYAWFKKSKVDGLPREQKEAVMKFFEAYSGTQDVQALVKNLLFSKSKDEDLKRANILLEHSITNLQSCDFQSLNQIVNGWGDITKTKYLPSLIGLKSAITGTQADSETAKTDALLLEFDKWFHDHLSEISEKVSDK